MTTARAMETEDRKQAENIDAERNGYDTKSTTEGSLDVLKGHR